MVDALPKIMQMLHYTVSMTLKATLGGLTFSQGLFHNIPQFTDWYKILARRDQLVNDALSHANKKCINYDHQSGQKVLRVQNTIKD